MDEAPTELQESALDALRENRLENLNRYAQKDRLPHATSPGATRKAVAYSERFLKAALAPRAVGVLDRILSGEDTAPGVETRARVAMQVLDRAGLVAPKAPEHPKSRKQLKDLSTSELQAVLANISRMLSDRASPVPAAQVIPPGDNAPTSEDDDAQGVDLFA